ncbi:MAG: hypothetical protein AB7G37_01640 [Solirubrobacteraceae bacterium]
MPSPADDRRGARRTARPSPPPPDARPPVPDDDDWRLNPRVAWATTLAVALVSLAVLILLFSGSGETAAPPPDFVTDPSAAPQVQRVDGTLVVVEQDRLVLQPFSGGADMEFTIEPEDRGNFDIAHLQSHSSVALPTRIHYERVGDRLLARYKEDAPANSHREAQE